MKKLLFFLLTFSIISINAMEESNSINARKKQKGELPEIVTYNPESLKTRCIQFIATSNSENLSLSAIETKLPEELFSHISIRREGAQKIIDGQTIQPIDLVGLSDNEKEEILKNSKNNLRKHLYQTIMPHKLFFDHDEYFFAHFIHPQSSLIYFFLKNELAQDKMIDEALAKIELDPSKLTIDALLCLKYIMQTCKKNDFNGPAEARYTNNLLKNQDYIIRLKQIVKDQTQNKTIAAFFNQNIIDKVFVTFLEYSDC